MKSGGRVTPHQWRTAPMPSAAFAVPSAARAAATQTPAMAVVFMCNLTLGTGPLTLPYAFEAAGIGLGTIFLLFIGFVAFMQATFLVETMSCCNALKYLFPRDYARRGASGAINTRWRWRSRAARR